METYLSFDANYTVYDSLYPYWEPLADKHKNKKYVDADVGNF
jgi:hypothetical protein